jgi:hypothetical protein
MEVTRFGGVAACALAANAVGVDEAPSGDVRGRVRESSGVRRAARAWECASSALARARAWIKKSRHCQQKPNRAVKDRGSL